MALFHCMHSPDTNSDKTVHYCKIGSGPAEYVCSSNGQAYLEIHMLSMPEGS